MQIPTFFQKNFEPTRNEILDTPLPTGLSFFAYYIRAPLRSVSSLTIMGAPLDQFICILFRDPSHISFFAYYMGPPQIICFAYYMYMGPFQISFFAYYMGAPSNQLYRLLYGRFPHLNSIGIKIARVIGLLRKLKLIYASYTSVAIYL